MTDPIPTYLKPLPRSAREKFSLLKNAERRSRALIDGLHGQIERARETINECRQTLGMFDRANPPIIKVVPIEGGEERQHFDPPGRAELLADLEAAQADLRSLIEQQKAANPGFNLSDIQDWLKDHRGPFKEAATVKLPKGDLADALTKNREEQRAVRDQIATAQNVKSPSDEAKQLLRSQIEALAAKGRPEVAPLFYGLEFGFNTTLLTTNGAGHHPHVSVVSVPDTLALLIYVHKEALLAKLDAEIDAQAEDENALSREQRAAKVRQLETDLLNLQRQEESIVCALEAQGRPTPRNYPTPLAMLGIEVAA